MSKTKKFHYAFVILIAVSLIRGFSGPAINASSGLFLTPVSNDLGIGIGQLSLYLSISSIATFLFLPLGGTLLNKVNVKWLAAGGVLLQAVAFIALGWMRSVWGWYILAVPLAIGGAILVNLLGPVLINRWFTKQQGLMMGLMMTITGLLGAVFQPVLTTMIDGQGWRMTYIVFGAIALVAMMVLALLLLKNRPADIGREPYGAQGPKERQQQASGHTAAGVTAKEAVRCPAFFMLLLYMVVLTGFAAFSQHLTTYGLGVGFTMGSIGTALSLSMIGAAIGSLLIGFVCDRWGALNTALCVTAISVVTVIAFWVGGGSYPVFLTAAFLHGLSGAAIAVLAPLLTTDFLGKKDYEKVFSLVMMGAPLASVILMPAYGFVYDAFGSYQYVFLFLLVALAGGAVALIFGKRSSKKLLEGKR